MGAGYLKFPLILLQRKFIPKTTPIRLSTYWKNGNLGVSFCVYSFYPTMSNAAAIPYFDIESYLAFESEATEKHEYYRGEVFSLAGGSMNHSRIGRNICTTLQRKLAGKPREPFNSDMRLHIPSEGFFGYPDVSVVCGKPETYRESILNPVLLVKVLSPSTERHDRTTKFRFYREILSLTEFLLVSQEQRLVELFRRNEAGRWEIIELPNDCHEVTLEPCGCTITMDEIYENVETAE